MPIKKNEIFEINDEIQFVYRVLFAKVQKTHTSIEDNLTEISDTR